MSIEVGVKECDCNDAEQDRLYGEGFRVHNAMAGGEHNKNVSGWRRTSCGSEKGIG